MLPFLTAALVAASFAFAAPASAQAIIFDWGGGHRPHVVAPHHGYVAPRHVVVPPGHYGAPPGHYVRPRRVVREHHYVQRPVCRIHRERVFDPYRGWVVRQHRVCS
jgi:hypothetical protein